MTHENDIMALIAERLEVGRKKYGALDVHCGRDWKQEALEEALDMCVYLAAEVKRLEREPRELGGVIATTERDVKEFRIRAEKAETEADRLRAQLNATVYYGDLASEMHAGREVMREKMQRAEARVKELETTIANGKAHRGSCTKPSDLVHREAFEQVCRERDEQRVALDVLRESERGWHTRAMRAEARAKELEARNDELRRYDARKLMRCPECGSGIKLGGTNTNAVFWYCRDVMKHQGPFDDTPLAALLAWHEEKP